MNYMPEGLGSLKPYEFTVNCRKKEEEEYFFQTASGTSYICYFLSASGYFEDYPSIKDNIVTFGFRPLSQLSKGSFIDGHDRRIKETIFCILTHATARRPERYLLVMYETSDGKQRNRKITFNCWYNEYCALVNNQVTRISIIAPNIEGDDTFSLMVFVPSTCSKLELIKNTFIEIKDEFISKGYPPSLECRIECK
jgi:hypothetical protein